MQPSKSHPSALPSIRGLDIPWPDWASSDAADSRYDRVVVNSTGVSALTLAGRLARSSELAGRVRVVALPVEENRRLIGGVTLRARTIDYYAAAMGVERDTFLREMFGGDCRTAVADQQIGAMCAGTLESGFRIVKKACFMDGRRPRRGRSEQLPLAYGVRNSRLRATLQKFAIDAGVRLTPEVVPTLEGLLDHAEGDRPLVVNGTPRPLVTAAETAGLGRSRQFVGAAQMAFRSTALDAKGVIARNASVACWVRQGAALSMGVYYPFLDPLSPAADYYGIFYRVVPARDASATKDELLETLEGTVRGIGEAIGLEPVDPEETLGTALVPVSPWRRVVNCQPGVLDLSRIAGAGSPIITGDGMTKSAIAGLIAAESILRGRDPVADTNRALGGYRQLNLELHLALTGLAGIASRLFRWSPSLVLFRQTRSYYRDMWAGAY